MICRILFFAAALSGGALLPTQAMALSWELGRDEYSCYSATRNSGAARTVLATDNQGGYRIEHQFPVGYVDTTIPQLSTLTLQATSAPQYESTVGYSGGQALVEIKGDAGVVDWVARTEPRFKLSRAGTYLGEFTVSGISAARNALATCTPVVPPPNRALVATGNRALWVDIDDKMMGALYTVKSVGPVAAELAVNTRGRVDKCRMTIPSGVALVDTLFCEQLKRRARFRAATDANGRHIAATHQYRVTKLSISD